jgi:hypothetical protein
MQRLRIANCGLRIDKRTVSDDQSLALSPCVMSSGLGVVDGLGTGVEPGVMVGVGVGGAVGFGVDGGVVVGSGVEVFR